MREIIAFLIAFNLVYLLYVAIRSIVYLFDKTSYEYKKDFFDYVIWDKEYTNLLTNFYAIYVLVVNLIALIIYLTLLISKML